MAINFRILPVECQFEAIYFPFSLACLISYNGSIKNFCSSLFSQKYLPREYRENKSLAKLNRFTVVQAKNWSGGMDR